jgi:predicted ATPase
MISLIESLNYRCLRYVKQSLTPFRLIVGPNATGKSTFLDVPAFLRDLVLTGPVEAVFSRTNNFSDLVWQYEDKGFELAIEAKIPDEKRSLLENPDYDCVRYEVGLRLDPETKHIAIVVEQGILKVSRTSVPHQRTLFPVLHDQPDTLVTAHSRRGTRTLFRKTYGGNDNYYAEAHPKEGRWRPSFKLGPQKSTLANLPEDETNFPVSTWLKRLFAEGVESVMLNSSKMRRASPPGLGTGFQPDGSNLPWIVSELEIRRPERLREWIEHLRTALPDLRGVRTILRDDDKHRYLKLSYDCGLEVPSWGASDGTLRLLALTLISYLDRLKSIYLVDEPENGIHPLAIEAMYQSMSSVYDAQVLMATHSPVILGIAEPADVLCFAKTSEGATDVVAGNEHPRLVDWRGEVDLGTLYASGVLG